MACNCFTTLGDQVKDHLTKQHAASIGEIDESGFDNQVFVLASGDFAPVQLNYKFRFFPLRKNGELSSKRTIADTSVRMNYCPLCGTKFEGETTSNN
ncbi:hypothetical protein [Klebsiella pasteurii]|uniref:hypothetical protein n=1 Tax=Klebsiella pasteurii TaxID=2587529 RepID=UPI0035CF888B